MKKKTRRIVYRKQKVCLVFIDLYFYLILSFLEIALMRPAANELHLHLCWLTNQSQHDVV